MSGESLLPQNIAADPFIGRWLFAETVYDPAGTRVGVIHQRRALEPQADGTVNVTEQCEPQPDLVGHPMASLRGSWNFQMRYEGRQRLYQGLDVYGNGICWGSRAILGRAVWPRLGLTSTSFAFLTSPSRQITGGRYTIGSHVVANLVGLAVRAQADGSEQVGVGEQFVSLEETTNPADIARLWAGSAQVFDGEGNITREITRFERAWSRSGWTTLIDGDVAEEMLFVPRSSGGFEAHSETQRGKWVGMGRHFDHTLEISGVFERTPDISTDYFGVLDPSGGHFIGVRRVYQGDRVQTVAIEQFHPL